MKNSNPQVSIIISAYNAEATIEDSINSILNQSFQNFELLIADDASTDNTKALIDQFEDPRIRRYHNSTNMHVCWTWNKMLENVKTPYVTFQDADDISYPQRLEKLIEAASENPEYAIIGANHLRPLEKWRTYRTSNFLLSNDDIIAKVKNEGTLDSCGPRSLFKTSIIQEKGGFRMLFPKSGWEDFDLILRIVPEHKIMNIPDVLYEYRYEAKSYSRIASDSEALEKIFIHEIGIFLFRERLKNDGKDSLRAENNDALVSFIGHLTEKLKKDKSIPFRKRSMNQIANKDFTNAYKSVWKAIVIKPTVIKNYLCLIVAVKSNIISIARLIFNTKNYERDFSNFRHGLKDF